ncbi:restriction endonuclease subunit S [uncultured Helicobacter sp.]|uniref:restriction endonuclease subunit S n=1 Tax=uncultured Helicobacter sp. TaxID=175537 RepID=UPI002624BB87|nr:restriction endonuclease subunit S [uncultured Helicobacter sp.]
MSSLFHNLPQGWQVKTLGEVSKVITGKTPPKSHSEYFKGKIPFVKPNDLDKDIFICQSEDTLTELGFKHAPFVPKNSVLVSCIGNLGKKAILEINGSCNQQINAIIPNENLDYKFLYYQMNILRNWLEQNASATTIKIINKSKFEKAPIILPPLEVQKAIVEKLENAFAHIDEAVHHLKAVQTNIPRLKSSLLHCAFSGKLTESQNSSHKVQTLKSVVGVEGETLPFEPPHPLIKTEIPQGWEIKTLGEIGKVISGGTPSTSNKDNFDGEIAWITPADLSGYKEKYISKGKRNLSEQGLKNSSARLLPPNSILFSSRAPIGYVAIASNALCTNQGFKNLIPNGNVSSEYIYYFLLHSKRLAESVASGTTFKEISAASFSKLPIPLPPLATQNQIVQILESKFTHLDNLAQFVNESLENLQRLKSSLLNQAFKGELV